MPKKLTKKTTKRTVSKEVCKNEYSFFHKIFYKHINKHGHKVLHLTHKYHHQLTHLWELLLIGWFFAFNLISSGFAANSGTTLLTDHRLVATNLIKAETQGRPLTTDSKIISMRTMDGSVANSFYPWYCTYGAARISPEFFPYSWANTQVRTWWWNAKDRCANAQATGYSIGSTPREGALIVYSKIWSSSLFGHVGKVMYHNASNKTLIVRDMNRVGKFTMTDRREDTSNPNISCYIYNKKAEILTPQDIQQVITVVTTPTNNTTWTLIAANTNNPDIITTIIPPTTNNTTTTTNNTNTKPEITPEIIPETKQNISLNFNEVSDLGKHFLTQRSIKAEVKTFNQNISTLKIWETATLTLTIKDINTQMGFEWLLDVPFELITSNGNIDTSYALIQLIKNGEIDITITAKEIGETTLLINLDWKNIGNIKFTIK